MKERQKKSWALVWNRSKLSGKIDVYCPLLRSQPNTLASLFVISQEIVNNKKGLDWRNVTDSYMRVNWKQQRSSKGLNRSLIIDNYQHLVIWFLISTFGSFLIMYFTYIYEKEKLSQYWIVLPVITKLIYTFVFCPRLADFFI